MAREQGFLAGKAVLVTGASRSLGAVIAQQLADLGATVGIGYYASFADADELAERLTAGTGREHVALAADLRDRDGVRVLLEQAHERLGRVDILVNNVGPFTLTPLKELAEEEWDTVWDVNVKAAWLASQLVAPAMRNAGWGRIVNISASFHVLRDHSIYALAKRAMIVLTQQLAVELAPEVTVNAIAPGQIAESADGMAEFDPEFVTRVTAATPLEPPSYHHW
jgi:NAD(P)-dependent dehydrogenase (short-subunit alcohol dehydrogenase family)